MRAGSKCAIIVKQSRLAVDPGLQKDAMGRVFRRGENQLPGLKIAGIDVHSSPRALRSAGSILSLHLLGLEFDPRQVSRRIQLRKRDEAPEQAGTHLVFVELGKIPGQGLTAGVDGAEDSRQIGFNGV